ncbi:TetR/AcrR family transcriptional regulator [Pseudonocardia kunmingensis]|uniref:TetR family transcriptional regulator n=1 Tax=Pseudonocardia kunmingensis TaxID=630975 RepID=A0A543DKG0_9PSEU|nr:TetR/AcrR family transcriptional regulator [Pseudonocardia kunmingensis]TQM09735.1 TetR family transcriptional regulator [Pseudonocardia kunmingensis]
MPSGTRDALLDASEELLDAGGVEAVTLREVGRRAGVSHNAPYKHFASKEALLAAIAARELRRMRDTLLGGPAPDVPPEVALRAAFEGYARWALAHPRRFRLIFGPWSTGSDELTRAADATKSRLLDVVRAAQERGALPAGPPERLTALLQAVAHGAADLETAGHLAPDGKGGTDAAGLVADLLDHLAGRPGQA